MVKNISSFVIVFPLVLLCEDLLNHRDKPNVCLFVDQWLQKNIVYSSTCRIYLHCYFLFFRVPYRKVKTEPYY